VTVPAGLDATILFADIGGSVRLYQEVGDAAGHQFVVESLELMASAIRAERGVLLRTVGDAALARFSHADEALRAAVAIQNAHHASPLSVRVGFHSGPVIEDNGDVYGHAVNLAARIASFARVNEITTSGGTVQTLSSEYQHRAALLKAASTVRGMQDTVDIFRIDWQPNQLGQEAATRIATRVITPTERPVDEFVQLLKIHYGERVWEVGSNRTSLTFGRTELADVCVLSDRASRDHAHIEFRQGQFTLTDTSTNGTYVQKNAQPVFIVQRETVVLDGRGWLGIGMEPNNDEQDSNLTTCQFSIDFG
jgi:adenylate cyclase